MLMLYWGGGGGLILTFYGGGFLNPQYLPNIGGLNTYVVQGELLNAYVKQGVPQCLCYIGGGGLNTYVLWGGVFNPQYLRSSGEVLNAYVKQGVPQCLCYIWGGGGAKYLLFMGGGGGSSILNTYQILGGLNTYVVQRELLNAYVKQGVAQCLCYIGGGGLNTYVSWGGVSQSSILTKYWGVSILT